MTPPLTFSPASGYERCQIPRRIERGTSGGRLPCRLKRFWGRDCTNVLPCPGQYRCATSDQPSAVMPATASGYVATKAVRLYRTDGKCFGPVRPCCSNLSKTWVSWMASNHKLYSRHGELIKVLISRNLVAFEAQVSYAGSTPGFPAIAGGLLLC